MVVDDHHTHTQGKAWEANKQQNICGLLLLINNYSKDVYWIFIEVLVVEKCWVLRQETAI